MGAALASVCELLGVPRSEDAARVPAVSGFLEIVTAAQAMADYRAMGHTREGAIEATAIELGIPLETLRSRIKNARKAAYGTKRESRATSHLPPTRRAA